MSQIQQMVPAGRPDSQPLCNRSFIIHMAWVVSFYRSNQITCGSQWHMHYVPLRTFAEQKHTLEALAVMWSCERFNDYLLGTTFHINMDHQPLVPLLSILNLECI